MDNATTNDIQELTHDELDAVTGGLIWVHVARTLAVIAAGGATVIREAMKGPEVLVPDISQVL